VTRRLIEKYQFQPSLFIQLTLAFASECCAFCSSSVASACFCLSRSAVKASAALSLVCYTALMRAAKGVSGWIGLIAVISFTRIWYLYGMPNSFSYYTKTLTHAYLPSLEKSAAQVSAKI